MRSNTDLVTNDGFGEDLFRGKKMSSLEKIEASLNLMLKCFILSGHFCPCLIVVMNDKLLQRSVLNVQTES